MSQRPPDRIPSYKFAKIATRNRFLDLIDSHPPFLRLELLPSPDDLKNSKFQWAYTQVETGGQSHFFRHYMDRKQLYLTLRAMIMGSVGQPAQLPTGQPNPKAGYLPGFPEFKGSEDSAYPQWPVTSRIMGIKWMMSNNGPAYAIEFSAGPGRKDPAKGIVTPDGSPAFKGGMILPIYGSASMPPLALHFAEEAEHYLQAREVSRQVVIANTLNNLRYLAAQGNAEAGRKYELALDSLYTTRKDPNVQQQQVPQGYQQAPGPHHAPAAPGGYNGEPQDPF